MLSHLSSVHGPSHVELPATTQIITDQPTEIPNHALSAQDNAITTSHGQHAIAVTQSCGMLNAVIVTAQHLQALTVNICGAVMSHTEPAQAPAVINTACHVAIAAVAAAWTHGTFTSHSIPAWTMAYYSTPRRRGTLWSHVNPAVTTPNHGTHAEPRHPMSALAEPQHPCSSHTDLSHVNLSHARTWLPSPHHAEPQRYNLTHATSWHAIRSRAGPCRSSPSHADRHAHSPRHTRPWWASLSRWTSCHHHSSHSSTHSRDQGLATHRRSTPCSSLHHHSRSSPHPRSCSPPTDHENHPFYQAKITQVGQFFADSPVMGCSPTHPLLEPRTPTWPVVSWPPSSLQSHGTLQSRVDQAVPAPSHVILAQAMQDHGGPARAMSYHMFPALPMLSPRVTVWAMPTHGVQVEAMLNHRIQVQAMANHGTLGQGMSGHGELHRAMPGHTNSAWSALNTMAAHPEVSDHIPALLLGLATQAAPPSAPGMDIVAYSHVAAYATIQGTVHDVVSGPLVLLGARRFHSFLKSSPVMVALPQLGQPPQAKTLGWLLLQAPCMLPDVPWICPMTE